MRAIDGNGHVPDEDSREAREDVTSDYDRGYSAGYNQAILDVVGKLAGQARDELDQINAKLEHLAQRPAA